MSYPTAPVTASHLRVTALSEASACIFVGIPDADTTVIGSDQSLVTVEFLALTLYTC